MKVLMSVSFTFPDGSEGYDVCTPEDIGETLDYVNANYPTVVDFKIHMLSEEKRKQPLGKE